MKHYLAVLVPRPEGGWRAHLPDFPGCRAEALSVDAAIMSGTLAAAAMAQSLRSQGRLLPLPQTFEDVRHYSNGWASERGIDWSKALISVVAVAVPDD